MAQYRKKPVIVEAVQWFKHGDHPAVIPATHRLEKHCQKCGKAGKSHGGIETLEGLMVACPGDWIITGVKGEHYPCKPDIFEATYEEVDNHEYDRTPSDTLQAAIDEMNAMG